MKGVLHVFSGDLWAGAEVMIFNLLSKLREDPGLNIAALSLNEGTLTCKLREMGIKTIVIPEADNSFPEIYLKSYKSLKNQKIDIIHSHRYKENLLALLLAKTLGIKKIVSTIHGLSEPLSYSQNNKNNDGLKTKLDYFTLRSKLFSSVVAVSREMKNTLVQKHHFKAEKIEVVYNGTFLPEKHKCDTFEQRSNGTFHIGTVGRMVPVKDFNFFLEIASEIRKAVRNVRFSILGDGPLKSRLIKKNLSLGLEDCVEFYQPVENPRAYYQSLDIYLNTSEYEGIPMSILEAMAYGIPVVAPKVGGIPEIISHGTEGFLVAERKHEEFVHYCLKLIRDMNVKQAITENASRKIISAFSNMKMAEAYKNIYLYDA